MIQRPQTARTKARAPRAAAIWKATAREVAKLADLLGRRIDRGIAPAVTALRAHGFDTSSSCQGHMSWGMPAPSVDVGVVHLTKKQHLSPSKAERNSLARMRSRNLREQRRMLALLDAFYRERATAVPVRLVVLPFGVFGGFTLTNQGAEVQPALPRSARQRRLREFQREFNRFADFLKARLQD
jgi:hypothetical protein